MQEWANALIERCGSVLFLRFILGGAARACPHQFTDPYNDSMIISLYINCMARIKYFFEYIRYAFFSCSGVAWLLYYS